MNMNWSFPIRGHVNGKIIDLNVVMFDCQRVFVFGIHGFSHQIWWFRVNLSLHQSDKQWRYTGVCVCVCQHGRCGQAGSGYIFLICHQPTKWRDIASKEREISSKHDKANTSWDVLNKVGNNWQHEDTKGKDVDGVYIAKECQRLVGRDRL